MAIKPVFIISLPRSGSTFLQKILMTHPAIASTAEPWFLLPLCYMKRKKGVVGEYGHIQTVNALHRIENECKAGLLDGCIADFATSIYKQYCKGNEYYFLDKTPRYYWIAEELLRIFPDAKFIVLLRNPVSVFSSSLEGLRGNSMRRMDHLNNDFKEGPERIGAFVEKNRDAICLVKYEDLVKDPVTTLKSILAYLELDYIEDMIEDSFTINLQGPGDHLGAKEYKEVVVNPDKWKKIICTPYRKIRLKCFLGYYPQNYLFAGAYDREKLLKSVAEHRSGWISPLECFYYIEELIIKISRFCITKMRRFLYG